jgi:hypothetical protein
MGLQEGAQKVASARNIRSIVLNADATEQQFALGFLGNLFVGVPGVEARAEAGNLAPGIEIKL